MIRAIRRNWNRLLGTFFRRHSEADLADEIESHIHHLAEEDIRRGLPPDEAFRRARIQFGGVEATKEIYPTDRRGPGNKGAGRREIRRPRIFFRHAHSASPWPGHRRVG